MRSDMVKISLGHGVGVFIGNLDECVGYYEIKPLVYKRFIGK